jgi:hypothetical protein
MEAPHRDDPSLSEEERLAPLLGKVHDLDIYFVGNYLLNTI